MTDCKESLIRSFLEDRSSLAASSLSSSRRPANLLTSFIVKTPATQTHLHVEQFGMPSSSREIAPLALQSLHVELVMSSRNVLIDGHTQAYRISGYSERRGAFAVPPDFLETSKSFFFFWNSFSNMACLFLMSLLSPTSTTVPLHWQRGQSNLAT